MNFIGFKNLKSTSVCYVYTIHSDFTCSLNFICKVTPILNDAGHFQPRQEIDPMQQDDETASAALK